MKQPETTLNNVQQRSTTLRAHQIIEGLEGHRDLRVAVKNLDIETAREITFGVSKLLRGSQKFLLTEDLIFPEEGETFPLIPETTKLPADHCYFERTQKGHTWGALCFMIEAEKAKEVDQIFPIAKKEKDLLLDIKWMCILFTKEPETGIWNLLPYVTGVYLTSEQNIKLVTSGLFSFAKQESYSEAEEIFRGLTRAATSEILYFLQMLSCSNVTMQTVERPHALNKKRAKKNLPVIDSYHVLKLPMHGKPKYEGQEHSDRNSPRLHFRRGHVRRLSPEQITWVSHCMVGDASKGSVEKHYEARA